MTSAPPAARPPSGARGHRRRTVVAALVLVAALVGGTFALTLDGSRDRERERSERVATEASSGPGERDESLLRLARREKGDPLAVGDVDAPVVMIEYSDFQCPYCGRFARETKPALLREQVEEGVLRIEWRNFPLFGEESERAALAAWAAGRQGKFWEFHDLAYAEPRKRNSGAFSEEAVEAMAEKAGVADIEQFRKDLGGAEGRAALERDQQEGSGLGVSSTPAFLVNGRPILGAQPGSIFTEAIEAAEADARRNSEAAGPGAEESAK
ncbi:DsbA family protein [Streptomyces sp. NPDC058374]|uniref:DsbA family protein n=1 Tax=Streptomyces sp. NPDC058374 TaxID=3346466 RepID=UPI0036590548